MTQREKTRHHVVFGNWEETETRAAMTAEREASLLREPQSPVAPARPVAAPGISCVASLDGKSSMQEVTREQDARRASVRRCGRASGNCLRPLGLCPIDLHHGEDEFGGPTSKRRGMGAGALRSRGHWGTCGQRCCRAWR